MATIYAIAPVALPDTDYLTPGKAYPVESEDELGGFRIKCDAGPSLLCLWSGCAHLSGGDWTRAEAKPLGDR